MIPRISYRSRDTTEGERLSGERGKRHCAGGCSRGTHASRDAWQALQRLKGFLIWCRAVLRHSLTVSEPIEIGC